MNTKSFELKVYFHYSVYLCLQIFLSAAGGLFLASLWFTGFALIDNILNFNLFFRWLNIILFAILAVRLIVRTIRCLKGIRPENILKIMEDRYSFKDTIISGYELRHDSRYDGFYLSNLFRTATENLKKVRWKDLLPYFNLKAAGLQCLIALILLFSYYFLVPANFLLSLNRFVNPEYRIKYSHVIVRTELQPRDIKVLEGSTVRFILYAFGQVKKPVLVLESPEHKVIRDDFNFLKTTNIGTNQVRMYEHTSNPIYNSFQYHALTIQTRDNIGIRTPSYSLRMIRLPIIRNLRITYIYPSYTQLKPRTISDNGNIEAVEKTRVQISGDVNNNLQEAVLFYNSRRIRLAVSENRFSGGFQLDQSGKYHIQITDINDNTDPASVRYSVIVNPDNPPEVEIIKPGTDISLQDDLLIPLEISARDDYAVAQLKLCYKINKSLIETGQEEIDFNIPRQPSLTHTTVWDLGKLSFIPGDVIEYFARVYDGYTPPESHTVNSRKYYIRFPTMEDMYKQADKESAKNVVTLEQLIREQKEQYQETDKMLKDMESKENLSYIEKKQLEKLKENQSRINKSLETLNEKLKQTTEKVREKNLHSTEVIKKMEDIHKLLNEVMNKQMKESMDKLSEVLKNVQLSEMKKKMLSQKLTQEEILKRLDKTLEMLKSVKNQKKVEGFKKTADELARKQQELLNKTLDRRSDQDQLKNTQDMIRKEYQDLKKSMEEFQQEMKGEKNGLEKAMDQINRQQENSGINENFQNSRNALHSKNQKESVRNQKQIVSKLDSLSSELSKMQNQGQQADVERLFAVLDASIFNLLQISGKIESYHNRTRKPEDPMKAE
ncbi:MAG: hypothetical protein PHF84_08975, partial [bacterium]|nr:hypothetical protein [bacterium]